MYVKRITAIVVAILVSTAVLAGTPSQAEAASVSIGGVARTHAKDIKSKGVIRTPAVKAAGHNAVVSRSYTLYRGKKKVATTSLQNKAISLKPGTYKVKTTAKYRPYTIKYKKVDGTQEVWKEVLVGHEDQLVALEGYFGPTQISQKEMPKFTGCYVHSVLPSMHTGRAESARFVCITDDSTDRIRDLYVFDADLDQFFWDMSDIEKELKVDGAPVYTLHPSFNDDGSFVVKDVWFKPISGTVSYSDWRENQYESVPVYESQLVTVKVKVNSPYRVYGATKTVTKTQTVKVGNSGYMTLYEYKKVKHNMKLSKVKSIVGGTGKVIDRWSWGSDDYVIRSFNGHDIVFEDGRVSSKYWN